MVLFFIFGGKKELSPKEKERELLKHKKRFKREHARAMRQVNIEKRRAQTQPTNQEPIDTAKIKKVKNTTIKALSELYAYLAKYKEHYERETKSMNKEELKYCPDISRKLYRAKQKIEVAVEALNKAKNP